MRRVIQNSDWPIAKISWLSGLRAFFLFSAALLPGAVNLRAQCPDTGQTKVIKPAQGTGYRFYKFIGDSSYVYFLDGKKFSFNDKDDPGKTFIFIDDFAYEPVLVETTDFGKYVKSSKPLDILRAQAKHAQDYMKSAVPSIVITDYGPSARKNPDGSDDRLFYLWKKESPPGSKDARQYLVSYIDQRRSCRFIFHALEGISFRRRRISSDPKIHLTFRYIVERPMYESALDANRALRQEIRGYIGKLIQATSAAEVIRE